MSKHTPGPWHLEHGHEMKGNEVYWQIHDGAHAICCNQFCYADNSEANARLIAAAPDLLEALSWFINDIDGTHTSMVEFDENVAKARRAIAKAEGGAA